MSKKTAKQKKKFPRTISSNVFIIFFILFIAQTSLWLLSIPLLGASDEPAHIVTAVADSHGQLFKKSPVSGSPITDVVVPKTFAVTESESFCYSLSYEPANCKLNKAECKTQLAN